METLSGMASVVWTLPDWQHAAYVPYICIFLIFLQRKNLAKAPIRGSRWGAAALVVGVLIYYLGLKAESAYIGFAAIQVLLAGVVLWFWGTRVFGILSFAWFFFIFTWPMPFLDGMIALPLRLVMSGTAHNLLNLIGTTNIQTGTAILSAPDLTAGLKTGDKFQIDIADPCSGLHSLFALLMISALAGYVSLKNVGFRWLLFFSAIPLAIAGNVVRILLLVWGTEKFGSDFAVGTDVNPTWFHMGCGYVVYFVALCFLFAIVSFLNSTRVERWMGRTAVKPGPIRPDVTMAPGA